MPIIKDMTFMKIKLIALALGAGLGLSTGAQAQWTGGYVEGGLGVRAATSKITMSATDGIDSGKLTQNVGERALLGSLGAGWRFEAGDAIFGIGAFWNPASNDAGEQKGSLDGVGLTEKLKQKDHWGVGVEAGWKLAAPTVVYTKLAMHRAKFTLSLEDDEETLGRVRRTHNGWGFGLGLRHMIDKNAYLFAEWQQVEFQSKKRTLADDDGVLTVKVAPRNTIGLIGAGFKF